MNKCCSQKETAEHYPISHHCPANGESYASVKRKNIVRPSGTLQHSVGATSLSLDRPANLEQSLENFAGFSGTPCTHAVTVNTSAISGESSPESRRSARIRKTKASTFDMASLAVEPYTIAPGIDGTSAMKRPSSSTAISTFMAVAWLTTGDSSRRILASAQACGISN